MNIKKLFAILLILSLVTLAGCGDTQYPKEVVALVNGKTISEEDIQDKVIERRMTIAFVNVLSSVQPSNMNSKEDIIKLLNTTEEDLTPDQIRYIESRERATKLLSNNEALNILIREEVLYQEALKEGYEISVNEAKQILEENKQLTAEMLKSNKEAQQKHNEIQKSVKKVYEQFGYELEEDYQNQRIDKIVQELSINRMKNQFNKVIADRFPKLNGFQIEVVSQNAWDDYSEYLLKKARIEILNEEYTIEMYGKPWDYGTLDLKSK